MEVSTTHGKEYIAKKGDRFEAKRHQPSDLWKTEGTIDSITTHGETYSQKKGDRYEARRQQPSDMWKVITFFERDPIKNLI